MTHITETLHQDHEKVSQLIGELKDSTRGGERRTALCQQIRHELMAHSEFEEEVFYPAIAKADADARKIVETALAEHEAVEELLDEIEEMDPTSQQLTTAIGRLEKAVQEHVEHEESRIFPIAQELLEEDDAAQMSREHDQMVKQHMQQAGV